MEISVFGSRRIVYKVYVYLDEHIRSEIFFILAVSVEGFPCEIVRGGEIFVVVGFENGIVVGLGEKFLVVVILIIALSLVYR